VDFGDINMELLILEVVDNLRKKRRTSNEASIIKKVLSQHPNLTEELVAAQIVLCKETGLIQKVISRTSVFFLLVSTFKNSFSLCF
jgi:hypothetical protein